MPTDNMWPEPTLGAAHATIAAVNPGAYASTRNRLDGAVTGLSPYLTHGLISLPEVHRLVGAHHRLPNEHSLVRELGWRAFFAHVWDHLGQDIHQSQRPGPLPDAAYATTLPADIAAGCTGVPAIDCAVRTLNSHGLLHNHARLWLASYVVHARRVHWHTGAQWMHSLLLDGDLASNHLSWQWVAGTFSSKPYLFNADNVAKYAPRPWHSHGSAIDLSYNDWQQLATGARPPLPAGTQAPTPTPGPELVTQPPPDQPWQDPSAAHVQVQQHHVQLHHPWAIGQPNPNATLHLGVAMAPWHRAHPWHVRRWHWINAALRPQVAACWWVNNVQQLALALAPASQVSVVANGHARDWIDALQHALHTLPGSPRLQVIQPPALFAPVQPMAQSFSAWWRRTRVL